MAAAAAVISAAACAAAPAERGGGATRPLRNIAPTPCPSACGTLDAASAPHHAAVITAHLLRSGGGGGGGEGSGCVPVGARSGLGVGSRPSWLGWG